MRVIDRAFFFFRALSMMLLVLGLSLITGFLLQRHIDRKNQLRLINGFESRLAAMNDDVIEDHHYTGLSEHEMRFATGDTVAILSLERLGIKVAITEGTGREQLRMSAGHFEESDLPGNGNFSIAGHSSVIYTCLFNMMREAVIGDEIEVITRHKRHRYVVSDISVVSPDTVSVLRHVNESVITIVTCTNEGRERLIIRGIEAT